MNKPLIKRYKKNPIFRPEEKNFWEDICVLNPGVIYREECDDFVMLYRAGGNEYNHIIRLGIALSKDGIHFERQSDKPIFDIDLRDADAGGFEDPRIVKIDGVYFITYASRFKTIGRYFDANEYTAEYLAEVRPDVYPAFARINHTVSYLAMTQDFKTFKRLGRITDSSVDDRDVFLFPERVNGKYVKISRPKFHDRRVKMPSIWITFSDDLIEWGPPSLLMTGEQWWETSRIGGACPPIKTDKGWLMFYHGVAEKDSYYRVGAVLLDLSDPSKIIARTKDFLMQAEEEYEVKGFYDGCIFPTSNILRGDDLYIYYGSADRFISLAMVSLKELLGYLVAKCMITKEGSNA